MKKNFISKWRKMILNGRKRHILTLSIFSQIPVEYFLKNLTKVDAVLTKVIDVKKTSFSEIFEGCVFVLPNEKSQWRDSGGHISVQLSQVAFLNSTFDSGHEIITGQKEKSILPSGQVKVWFTWLVGSHTNVDVKVVVYLSILYYTDTTDIF